MSRKPGSRSSNRAHVTFSLKLEEAVQRIQNRQSLTTITEVVSHSVLAYDVITKLLADGGVLRVHYADGTTDRVLLI